MAARVEIGDDHDAGVARSSRAGTNRNVNARPTIFGCPVRIGLVPRWIIEESEEVTPEMEELWNYAVYTLTKTFISLSLSLFYILFYLYFSLLFPYPLSLSLSLLILPSLCISLHFF